MIFNHTVANLFYYILFPILLFVPIYVKLLTIIKKYYTIFIEHTSIKENKKMNMLKNIKYNNIFNLLIYTYFCQTRKE
jgi:hypothetical protein